MKKRVFIAGIICILLISGGCSGNQKEKTEYRNKGIEALNAGNFEEALADFEAALAKSGGRAGGFEFDVLKYRGEAEYQMGDYAAAAHTFDILIQADKERAEYLYMRCIALAADGGWEAALSDYNRAKEKDADAAGSKEAFLMIGRVLEEENQSEKAMELYQKALDEGSAGGEIYNRMGLCRLREEKYNEALELFQKGISLGEEETLKELAFNEAVAYEYTGDFEKALECMQNYERTYGSSAETEHEIAFLKTR